MELFERAVATFGRHVQATTDAQWHDPTPCTDWDVRTLVNHVTVEQLWVPPLVGGANVADIGDRLDGDQLGVDPVAAWNSAVVASREAFGAPGALDGDVSLSSGPRPAVEYCWEMTVDALIHSWDLARGIGGDEALDEELVELTYERILPIAESLQESGMFAPPVPVAPTEPLQVRLLGLFGRRV
ncbi:MAG: TIGR03086 family protein [Acidimicrobiia bacterium]|nr:TIGR03086 family protein [Acidimicrobiia bacterium]